MAKIGIEQLREQIKPLLLFGELVLEAQETDKGFKLKIIEHEESRNYNPHIPETEENHSTDTCISILHTNSNGEVNYIEHPFGAFTKKNKSIVPVLLDLVGRTINVDELRIA